MAYAAEVRADVSSSPSSTYGSGGPLCLGGKSIGACRRNLIAVLIDAGVLFFPALQLRCRATTAIVILALGSLSTPGVSEGQNIRNAVLKAES